MVLLADNLAAQVALEKLERGLTAARQGNCAAAIPDLEAAVNENERLVQALNALAVCEAAMGNPDRASAGFERIAKLEPNAWQAWNNLGASYLSSNRPARALEALRKAVKLEPGAANAWFHLGAAFNALGRTVDAFGALDHAQRISSADTAITKAWLDTAAAIAIEASVRGLPFVAIRAVLDEVDDEIFGAEMADEDGSVKPLAATSFLLRNPATMLKLPRMIRNLSRATAAIADALMAIAHEGQDPAATKRARGPVERKRPR